MSVPVQAEAYQSTNHHKYATKNRIYQWHLQAFMDCFYGMVMQTEPRTILDAGCGEGYTLNYFAERNPEIRLHGVDLSEGAIQYAQKHFGEKAKFRTGSLYKLPFSDSSFDTVICSEVLEHLDEPDRALAELKRVARKAVVISVPLEPYFQWLNNVGQWLKISPDPEHVNFWTKDSFQEFVRRNLDNPTFAWKHIYQIAKAEV